MSTEGEEGKVEIKIEGLPKEEEKQPLKFRSVTKFWTPDDEEPQLCYLVGGERYWVYTIADGPYGLVHGVYKRKGLPWRCTTCFMRKGECNHITFIRANVESKLDPEDCLYFNTEIEDIKQDLTILSHLYLQKCQARIFVLSQLLYARLKYKLEKSPEELEKEKEKGELLMKEMLEYEKSYTDHVTKYMTHIHQDQAGFERDVRMLIAASWEMKDVWQKDYMEMNAFRLELDQFMFLCAAQSPEFVKGIQGLLQNYNIEVKKLMDELKGNQEKKTSPEEVPPLLKKSVEKVLEEEEDDDCDSCASTATACSHGEGEQIEDELPDLV